MKQVTKEILKNTANKLLFDMSDEQFEQLVKEFEIITKQMELIKDIPGVDDAERMTFPFDNANTYFREDIQSSPLNRDEVLKNASDVKDGQFRLPKVVK